MWETKFVTGKTMGGCEDIHVVNRACWTLIESVSATGIFIGYPEIGMLGAEFVELCIIPCKLEAADLDL
jgi:hypothetical protein